MHGSGLFQLVPPLVYIFLTTAGSVGGISQYNSNGVSHSVAGDVIVTLNKTSWRCDRIFCPRGTERCQVTKTKSTSDATKQIRDNICWAADNTMLVSERYTENIDPNEFDDLNLIVTSSGSSIISQNGSGDTRTLSPEEIEEINRNVNKSIQKSQETLRRNLEKARETIENAFKNINFGSFGRFW